MQADGKHCMQQIKVIDRTYDVNGDVWSRDGFSLRVGSGVTGNVPFSPEYIRTVTMCVHVSSKCNLRCKYCFGEHGGREPTLEEIKRFIDIVTALYPRADRYIVDMSGSGEPLLKLDTVLAVADYCNTLSDKFVREFLPTFVSNGTLLDADTVKKLQDACVIFGVSLDGSREAHDRNRVFADGRGSFDKIVENIKEIKSREFMGAAVTYSDGRLKDDFLSAVELLPTVSMKPVRYTDGNKFDEKEVCDGYDELISFVLEKHIAGERKYITALLNGDDYFGKFLKRVVLGASVYGRCEAGISRFSLGGDGKIYCCPAGVGNPECETGDLENGIRRSKIDRMWRSQSGEGCGDCAIRAVCGGECKIVSYNKFGTIDKTDRKMCTLKKHLVALSVYYCDRLAENNKAEREWLAEMSQKVADYYKPDEKLIDAVQRSDGKYTFTQLKRIKDADASEFDRINRELN